MPITRRRRANPPDQPENNNHHQEAGQIEEAAEQPLNAEPAPASPLIDPVGPIETPAPDSMPEAAAAAEQPEGVQPPLLATLRAASCFAARRRCRRRHHRRRLSHRPRYRPRRTKLHCLWAICCTWPTIPAIPALKRLAASCCIVFLRKAKPVGALAAGTAAPWPSPMTAGIHVAARSATSASPSARFAASGA